MKVDRVSFGLALIGLGILSLVFGDFALQWQPVPEWGAGRTLLADASGAVMILAGAGLFSRRYAKLSSAILLVYSLLWVLLLKLPHVVMMPMQEFNWLGLGEIAVVVAGAWVIFAEERPQNSSSLKFATGASGVRIARLIFALALIPIGLSHIVYVTQTIGFIPTWIPFRPFWAYFTGAAHIAAGLAVLFGVVPRLAARLEAVMIAVFTALVWLPLVATDPKSQLNWTGTFISCVIGAAAWVVAESLANGRPAVRVAA